jgi:DNA integrity scanning protein DisA with diadenylate cyclase activity
MQEEKDRYTFKNAYKHFELMQEYEAPLLQNLEKYFSIFYNKSKKVVYYKNQVFYDLSQIVQDVDKVSKFKKVVDTETVEHTDSIKKSMQILSEISPEDHEEFINFIRDFYYYYVFVYESDFSTKVHLERLYTDIKGQNVDQKLNDKFLSHLYHLFNHREIDDQELNKGLIKYIVSVSRTLDPKKTQSFYYYYYSYHKILKNHIRSL